jgi:hypothetical protein
MKNEMTKKFDQTKNKERKQQTREKRKKELKEET